MSEIVSVFKDIAQLNPLFRNQITSFSINQVAWLNFYGKGAFFKPHVDIPCSEKMFGSLVHIFPMPHGGGALLVRHRGTEWTFDSAADLSATPPSSVGYAAFFSDVEHEVAPRFLAIISH
jgi:hypothetical protein